MYFLVSEKHKLFVAWSPKCACSTVKTWFLKVTNTEFSGDVHNFIKQFYPQGNLNNYKNYTKILFIRNPYKRLVSGYLQRVVEWPKSEYNKDAYSNFDKFTHHCMKTLSFDGHHFNPQTSAEFSKLPSNWTWNHMIDIENFDNEIQKINQKIGVHISKFQRMHQHHYQNQDSKAYLISRNQLRKYTVHPSSQDFYNDEIKQRVYQIYQRDFEYFKKLGYDY